MSRFGAVLEIAQLEIKEGEEIAFEHAFEKARPLFEAAKGCTAVSINRSIEKPTRFRLFVNWESVEAHTVDFRNSPAFAEWRAIASPYFASPPEVEHVVTVKLT